MALGIKHPLPVIGQPRNEYRILVRNPLENIQFEDCEGDTRITLEWIVGRYVNGT
jgi:hypothetical protein